jgi:hypothetical protein
MLTREMTEDVAIKVVRPVEKTMVLKKGALMVIEMIAVRASLQNLTLLGRMTDSQTTIPIYSRIPMNSARHAGITH